MIKQHILIYIFCSVTIVVPIICSDSGTGIGPLKSPQSAPLRKSSGAGSSTMPASLSMDDVANHTADLMSALKTDVPSLQSDVQEALIDALTPDDSQIPQEGWGRRFVNWARGDKSRKKSPPKHGTIKREDAEKVSLKGHLVEMQNNLKKVTEQLTKTTEESTDKITKTMQNVAEKATGSFDGTTEQFTKWRACLPIIFFDICCVFGFARAFSHAHEDNSKATEQEILALQTTDTIQKLQHEKIRQIHLRNRNWNYAQAGSFLISALAAWKFRAHQDTERNLNLALVGAGGLVTGLWYYKKYQDEKTSEVLKKLHTPLSSQKDCPPANLPATTPQVETKKK